MHQQVVAGDRPGTVLLLEHPPTYTAGKRTEPHERPVDAGGAPGHRGRPRRQDHLPRAGPARGLPDRPAARARAGRRLRPPPRGGDDRHLRATSAWSPRGSPAAAASGSAPTTAAPGAQGRRHRAAGQPRRDHARHRAQLRRGPRLVRPVRARAASPTPASRRSRTRPGRDVPVTEVLPVLQRHLAELLAWEPYAATPDYEPRPDPAKREPRIELGPALASCQ